MHVTLQNGLQMTNNKTHADCLLKLYFYGLFSLNTYVSSFYWKINTVGTESIQTPLNFSLFVILQPFAKII